MNILSRYLNANSRGDIMCLIPCKDDCIYQQDGYCTLDKPSAVTNQEDKGCVHYIKRKPASST